MSDKVYYDESCYVCSLEINALRKRGEACGIEFVDISGPDFNPYTVEDQLRGHNFESEMIGKFNGRPTVGVETFRIMYERMGFTRLVSFSRLPIIRNAVNAGYKVFAYGIRPHLPKKKRSKR